MIQDIQVLEDTQKNLQTTLTKTNELLLQLNLVYVSILSEGHPSLSGEGFLPQNLFADNLAETSQSPGKYSESSPSDYQEDQLLILAKLVVWGLMSICFKLHLS